MSLKLSLTLVEVLQRTSTLGTFKEDSNFKRVKKRTHERFLRRGAAISGMPARSEASSHVGKHQRQLAGTIEEGSDHVHGGEDRKIRLAGGLLEYELSWTEGYTRCVERGL